MREGVRSKRMVEARNLCSVEGREERARRWTSKVDLEGFSEARRTSMGPEMEARDFVGPERTESDTERRRQGCQ